MKAGLLTMLAGLVIAILDAALHAHYETLANNTGRTLVLHDPTWLGYLGLAIFLGGAVLAIRPEGRKGGT